MVTLGDTCSQIEHVLDDGRYFSIVIDVMSYRDPDIDSNNSVANIQRHEFKKRAMRFNIQRSAKEVAAQYHQKPNDRTWETNWV